LLLVPLAVVLHPPLQGPDSQVKPVDQHAVFEELDLRLGSGEARVHDAQPES
jgi:hypothetical protein